MSEADDDDDGGTRSEDKTVMAETTAPCAEELTGLALDGQRRRDLASRRVQSHDDLLGASGPSVDHRVGTVDVADELPIAIVGQCGRVLS